MVVTQTLRVVGWALLAGAPGCEAVLGADFDGARPLPDCHLALAVAPPAVPDPSGALEPLVFVISSLDLGDEPSEDGSPGLDRVGLDLDGACTGPTVPPPCLPPEWCGGEPSDSAGGRDNGLLRLLRASSVSEDVFRSASVNDRVAAGTAAPNAILRVSGYEGLDNDPAIEVELFVGIASALYDPPLPPPRFDGADRLPVALDSIEGSAVDSRRARYRATRAYVSDFVLVAEFERAALSLANVVMSVNDVILSARIASTAPRRALTEGTVAGWVASGDMLAAISDTAYQLYRVPLCTGSPTYSSSKALACSFADLARTELPSVGEGRCNALAFGYGFDAVAAELGEAVERPFVQACSDAEDPRRDSCAAP